MTEGARTFSLPRAALVEHPLPELLALSQEESRPECSCCAPPEARVCLYLRSSEQTVALALLEHAVGVGEEAGVLMPPPLCTGSAGETFLSTIQRAAEVVVNAVRPGPDNPCTKGPLPHGDAYQPAVTPSASHTHPNPGNLLPAAIQGTRGKAARVATLEV